jgi:hypothetical protein
MAQPWDELWPSARPGVWRRVGRGLRAAFGRLWAPVPAAFEAIGLTATRGLEACGSCGRDMVAPIEWHPVDEERWSLRLRCGQCGTARRTVASNAEVAEYEGALNAHQSAIERALAQMETLRMAEQVACFTEALRRDLIDAADFSRPAVAREAGPEALA